MNLDLISVGATPRHIEQIFELDEIDLEGDTKLTDRTMLTGEIWREGRRVRLKGRIHAGIEIACTRCLEPIEQTLDFEFEDVFVDAAEEQAAADIEITSDALDESLAEGGKIDLKEITREQILLALPLMPLCSDDCRGLCPDCGANRNLIDCKCVDSTDDPRWAALKKLK